MPVPPGPPPAIVDRSLHRIDTTLVSVVFEAEFALLLLQARSLAQFVRPDLLAEVIVIDNSAHGLPDDYRQELLVAYGQHAEQVRVLRPEQICALPTSTGWRSAQVLKLCVAELISSERYLVLDAKNHFVHPLRPDFLAAADGRPRVSAYSYRAHPLRPALEHVLRYLGLDPTAQVELFTATVTPFVLDTATVRALIRDIGARSGLVDPVHGFAQEFVANDLTEFFLYSGWILARGQPLAEAFELHDVGCPVVWPKAATAAGVGAAIESAQQRKTPVFAVHRRALAHLDQDARAELAAFWVHRDLFDSTAAAEQFIGDFQADHPRHARRQHLRELPGKIRSLPRKLRQRLRSRRFGDSPCFASPFFAGSFFAGSFFASPFFAGSFFAAPLLADSFFAGVLLSRFVNPCLNGRRCTQPCCART